MNPEGDEEATATTAAATSAAAAAVGAGAAGSLNFRGRLARDEGQGILACCLP